MKRFFRINVIAMVIILLTIEFVNAQKYVFLFIGDGMGQTSIDLYESYLAEINNEKGYKQSNITKLPLLSMCSTVAQNSRITDSGASGSAIACGQKFNLSEISYSEDENQPKSIAKYAKEKGLKVGIISTQSLNHATPAAFYANQKSRKNYYPIGLQLTESNFDFFGGGGFYHHSGRKKEDKDLTTIYQESGYLTFSSLKAISSLPNKNIKVIFTNETLERDCSMPYAIDRVDSPNSSLAEIVETAISHLDNPNGFFMMVEGGKIDAAAHENDARAIIGEMEDFDNAIAKAYEFYLQHKDETAIIVTADHETSGIALGIKQHGKDSNIGILKKQKMSMYKFSNILRKLSKNDKVFTLKEYHNMASEYFMGVEMEFSADESVVLNDAYNAVNATSNRAIEEAREAYEGYNPMAYAYNRIMNMRASVGFSTNDHTSARVPIYAVGITKPILDNTEFYNVIKSFIDK